MNKRQRESVLDMIDRAEKERQTWRSVLESTERRDPDVCEAARAEHWLWTNIKDHCRTLIINDDEQE